MTDKVMEKWKQKIRNMKKEDYIVLLLIGVLLLIISLPADRGQEYPDRAAVRGLVWNSRRLKRCAGASEKGERYLGKGDE